jgi:ubiquinone/menaquinone biosynthesis C-methylase UbiE
MVAGSQPPQSWSQIAGWYDERVSAGSGPHRTAVDCLLRLVPDLTEADVLDVACGQGLATRAIADAGARSVVGIDSSATMIELAGQHRVTGGVMSYRVDDAERLDSCPDAAFDGVTCQLGLMDIPDLAAALAAIRRVLRPGGWFVFVIGHPCFLAPGAETTQGSDGQPGRLVSRYLDEGFWRSSNPDGIRGRAGNHHRTISTYLNALVAAGFSLAAVQEPMGDPLLLAEQPVYASVPIILGVRAYPSPRPG